MNPDNQGTGALVRAGFLMGVGTLCAYGLVALGLNLFAPTPKKALPAVKKAGCGCGCSGGA